MKEKKLIAYLILAHHQPEHFFDLVSQLNHEEVCFFVHIDKKSDQALFLSKVQKLKNIHFVQTRINVIWGGFSMVEATLKLMQLALNSPYNFKYFVLRSGVCYPIKSNDYIIQFFQNSHQDYIDAREINEQYQKYKYLFEQLYLSIAIFISPQRKWQEYTAYCHQYKPIVRSHYWNFYRLIDCKAKVLYLLNSCLNIILPSKKIPKSIKKFYHGSQWWYLRQETVTLLVQFLTDKKNKNVIRFYKFSECSDERVFQTVLKNIENRPCSNVTNIEDIAVYRTEDTKTGDWCKVLDEQDFPAIQQSEKLFARKFDVQKSAKLKQKIKDIQA